MKSFVRSCPTLHAQPCTPNGKMSPLFWTCTLTTMSSAESADVVGCAIASSIQLRRAFTTWTERRVGNPARTACLGKSVLFPRHTPPRAGPHCALWARSTAQCSVVCHNRQQCGRGICSVECVHTTRVNATAVVSRNFCFFMLIAMQWSLHVAAGAARTLVVAVVATEYCAPCSVGIPTLSLIHI